MNPERGGFVPGQKRSNLSLNCVNHTAVSDPLPIDSGVRQLLTARAWWFLFWVGGFALQSVIWLSFYAPSIALLSLTLLFGVACEAILFLLRVQNLAGRLIVQRQLIQGERVVPTLWAGVPAKVRVTIRLERGLPISFAVFAEALPHGIPKVEGHRRTIARIAVGEPVTIEYELLPEAPGSVRFEGIEVRIADLMGFFTKRIFLRVPQEYSVLPPLMKEEGGQRSIKRFNSLPPPGVHRLKRAGSGGELLDLRDYRPGDPPKMIAWKASARRDRLITKEFESDVPVRCMLFLDASVATRIGEPGATPVVRMSAIAAGVAQAAAGHRDIVGLTVFDETEAHATKPARTRGHTLNLLRTFAETAGRSPESTETNPVVLQRYAYSVAQEFYPDLLEKRWNARPLGLFWLPLLDTRWSRWLLVPAVIQVLMFIVPGSVNAVVELTSEIVRPRSLWHIIPMLLVFCGLMFAPTILTAFAWIIFGLRGFLPPRSRELSKRKQLAALFAAKNGDGAAAVERAIQDDEFFAERTGWFLAEHRRTPPPKLLDERGRNRFRGESKLIVLANSIQRSIGVARDNELYILFLEPTDLADHLEPLLRAVRAARAKHHQVLVLLAEPADLPDMGKPSPLEGEVDSRSESGGAARSSPTPHPPRSAATSPSRGEVKEFPKRRKISLGEVVRSSLADDYRENFERVSKQLVRAGASLVKLEATDTIRAVIDRLDRLRGGRVLR